MIKQKILRFTVLAALIVALSGAREPQAQKPQVENRKARVVKVMIATALNLSIVASNPFFAELEAWKKIQVSPEQAHPEKAFIV